MAAATGSHPTVVSTRAVLHSRNPLRPTTAASTPVEDDSAPVRSVTPSSPTTATATATAAYSTHVDQNAWPTYRRAVLSAQRQTSPAVAIAIPTSFPGLDRDPGDWRDLPSVLCPFRVL
ncbi:hypothetical protein OE88DRAFT_1658865 [Heliocybe sulcata]|uniref:Uncharacterized protein n=1 Tax=Heliocybe sulcata TaxID=5364 RepID=A0A5C3NEV6_9AGAM|nr:hypothetical protein OE88DRAFT_1658865 [Heliocybe sulcata]